MQKKVSNSYVLCCVIKILWATLQSQYCSCTVLFAVQTGRLTASDSLPISSQDKDDTSIFNEETGDIPCCMPQ